jgi:hypothetical protein
MTLVIVPLTRKAPETPEMIGRFAGFLRDLTGDVPAWRVHEVIAEHCAISGPDPRIDGALADSDAFAAIWDGLIAGTPAPAGAWERVVLPAVVAFSNPTNAKAHLELATSFWVAVRSIAEAAAPGDTVPVAPAPGPAEEAGAAVVVLPQPEPRAGKRGRWVWIIAVMAIITLLALAIVWSQRGGRPASNTLPTLDTDLITSTQASPLPTAEATPVAAVAMPPQEGLDPPAPSPTWDGLGPNVTLKPGTTVPLGNSFTVSGTGWTCASKAKVELLLRGQPIVRKDANDAGAFSAAIDVHTDHGSAPYVKVLDGGGELTLTAGTFDLLVRLVPGQSQCATDLARTIRMTFI